MDSEIWLQISIAFYIFVATVVAWYAFVVKKSSPFEPIGPRSGRRKDAPKFSQT